MNWDQLEGKWKQASGKVKEKWGKLTDSDLEIIRGRRDQLIGKIQERYGVMKEEAQKQADEFTRTLVLVGEELVHSSTRRRRRIRGEPGCLSPRPEEPRRRTLAANSKSEEINPEPSAHLEMHARSEWPETR